MRTAVAAAILTLWSLFPALAQVISDASYTAPTMAYPHGVLGDKQEWGAIRITVERRQGTEGSLLAGHLSLTYEINALPDTVFEDIAPRLWDVTGDDDSEVVVVESHQNHGARLLIIGLNDGKPDHLAATPYIGTRFRWLAPAGAADLDGDGYVEIAYVDRPHLAKTLRIWRFRDGGLTEIASLPGLTNHRIGEDFISGGLRDCGKGPELVVASADWRRIVSVRYDGGWVRQDIAPFTRSRMEHAMRCE